MAKGSYATLHDRLRGPIREALKEQLKIKNIHALPRIEKVILNVGINKSKMDSKEIHAYIGECLSTITGLKPIYTKARVAISNFKTREGLVVGAMVTLRGRRMEEFIDRLLSTALPRIRDFRGIPKSSVDQHGNLTFGIKEHIVFPEIVLEKSRVSFGIEITIVPRKRMKPEEGLAFYAKLGVPFEKEAKINKKR